MLKLKETFKSRQMIYIIFAVVLVAAVVLAVIFIPKSSGSSDSTANTQSASVKSVTSDNSATITLNGSQIQSSGSGVLVKDSTAIITDGGTYTISGSLKNGRIIVDAENQVVNIILNGAAINCDDQAAINVYKSKQTIITLKNGTENTLTSGESYVFTDEYSSKEDEEPSAALFSKSDLCINGTGLLKITSKYKNGIQSKDNLIIDSANITVDSANDAVKGKDSVTIKNATLSLTAKGDGIVSNNSTDSNLGYVTIENSKITVNATADGIKAHTKLNISGGEYNITTNGGSDNGTKSKRSGFGFNESTSTDGTSAKGLKGGESVVISGGTFTVNSSDDTVHSNGTVEISNGTLTLSSGDDGIHADSKITLSGGKINIKTSYEGIESNDIIISGGEIYVTASDDGVNVSSGKETTNQDGGMDAVTAGTLSVKGGYLYVDASGDGLDSNGNIDISGGTVIVNGPTDNGNGALDYNGKMTVTGGTVIAAGSSGMVQNASDSSTQGCVLANFTSQSANTVISVVDSNNNVILSFAPTKQFSSIFISTASLKSGESYTVYSGGTVSGENKDGLYSSPKLSGGTQLLTFTLSSTVTSVGNAQNANAPDGNMGGNVGGNMGTPPDNNGGFGKR